MKKDYEFFGILIKQVGADQYTANVRGYEFKGSSINEVQELIMKKQREERRDNIIERLRRVGMCESAANFVVDMTTAYHSTEGAALMRIGDYLSACGM